MAFLGVIFPEVSDIFKYSNDEHRFRKGKNDDECQEQMKDKNFRLQPCLIP